MDFWRSPAYQAYFAHLEAQGGFYYERWGDAPVHSIAAALFLPKEKIHLFDEIGYEVRLRWLGACMWGDEGLMTRAA
jgi:alpha 1,2-mannosyltransferase